MPLGELLKWPAWQLDAYQAFVQREPPPDQRIEMILAQIATRVFNATRPQGVSAVSFQDFLQPRDLWGSPAPSSGLTLEEMQMIGHIEQRPPHS